MITVKLFTLLRLQLGVDAVEVDADAMDARKLVCRVDQELQSDLLKQKLLDERGGLRPGSIVLVNGHDILDLDNLATVVHRGDTVSLFTPGGGG